MTNVLFPTSGAGFSFNPSLQVEIAKGAFSTLGGILSEAPTTGWVLQAAGPQEDWAVTLTTADSTRYSVWIRIAGDQTSARMIFNGDVSLSGERLLREDGTAITRESGNHFRKEPNTTFPVIRPPG